MVNTQSVAFRVNAGGAANYLALIQDADDSDITQAATSSVERRVELDRTGAVSTSTLTVSAVVFDSQQSSTRIPGGVYNFRDKIADTVFANQEKYWLQYKITLTDGTVIRTDAVPVEGDKEV